MRKVKEYTVPTPETGQRENRDAGKIFILTEMPASQAEKWAMRAFMSLSAGGVRIPDGIVELGMAGFALVSFQAFYNARFDDVEPLMDEMFQCVQAKPSAQVIRPLIEEDIEEISTRVMLRKELLELHMGFSFAEAALMLKATVPAEISSGTPTSPPSSAPPSP